MSSASLHAGHAGDQRGPELAGAVAQERGQRPGREALLAVRLAQPQEDRAGLLLRLEADQQHRARRLQVGEGDALSGAGHGMDQEVGLLVGVGPSPEVDVVRTQHHSGELRVAVGVLQGEPATGEHAGPVAERERGPLRRSAGRLQAADRYVDRLRPGRGPEHASLAYQRPGQPVLTPPVREGVPVLIGDPLLVDLRVVPGHPAHHGPLPGGRPGWPTHTRRARPPRGWRPDRKAWSGTDKPRWSARRRGRSESCCRRSRTGAAQCRRSRPAATPRVRSGR